MLRHRPQPKEAPHILIPTAQKSEVTHHFPQPLPESSFPSLPETETQPSLLQGRSTSYLPTHFSIAPPLMAPGPGRRGLEINSTPASGRGVGDALCRDRSLVQSPESWGLGGMTPQKDISE